MNSLVKEKSGIYLVRTSTGSEFASALGKEALGSSACFATKRSSSVEEILASFSDVLFVHHSAKMARWASHVSGARWGPVVQIQGRPEISKGGQFGESASGR
jgi:hypothetical protein